MDHKQTIVAALPCRDYEEERVYEALRRGVLALGGWAAFLRPEERVLVKPNLLKPADAESAVTIHPAVIRGVLRLLAEYGCTQLRFGDSPGHDSGEAALARLGLLDGELYGAQLAPMTEERRVPFPEGLCEKEFYFAKEVLEAEAIVNVCKMKTHALMGLTGAVKNLFGLLCGHRKAMEHVRFPNAGLFARMLVDIHRCVKPRLHIMDAVLAMEGNGPGSGTPTPVGLLLLSADPVALDTVFCRLVGVEPASVPTNVQGQAMGLGTCREEEICVRLCAEDGTEQEMEVAAFAAAYGKRDFDAQGKGRSALTRLMGLLSAFSRRPVIQKERCVSCGVCVEHCPAPGKALSFRDGRGKPPVYDYRKCIRCYCCQEMCPQKAITVAEKRGKQPEP